MRYFIVTFSVAKENGEIENGLKMAVRTKAKTQRGIARAAERTIRRIFPDAEIEEIREFIPDKPILENQKIINVSKMFIA